MSNRFRGNTAETVLEALAEAESHCAFANGPRRFRKLGSWLVHEQYLEDLIFRKDFWQEDRRLPGLVGTRSPGTLAMLLWKRCFGQLYIGNSSAEAIRVKSNGRAFYLKKERACSIKFLLQGRGRKPQNLINEVETRVRLSAGGAVRMPEIFSHSIQDSPFYICEELLNGRRCQAEDAPALCEQLVPQLIALYQQEGLVVRQVDEVLDAPLLLTKLERAIALAAWRPEWIPQAQFMREADRTAAPGNSLICSLGHGDFSLGNMLLTSSGEIYIIDWEKARERPVLFELCKFLRDIPSARPMIQAVLERFMTNGPASMLSFERQLFLGSLAAAGDLMDMASGAEGKQRAWVHSRLVNELDHAQTLFRESIADSGTPK